MNKFLIIVMKLFLGYEIISFDDENCSSTLSEMIKSDPLSVSQGGGQFWSFRSKVDFTA